jgi:hypothetical protein
MTRSLPVRIAGAAVAASALLAAGTTHAQPAPFASLASPSPAVATTVATFAPVPFAVGEELKYKATFGGIRAGTARMRVEGIELVRGRPAYHVVFSLDGGVPLFRVHDRYESWIDVETLSSLRYRQRIAEGRFRRDATYEIYPERAQYRRDADSLQASVAQPLDDGSFIYAVRVAGIRVGETRRDDRYFKPDRNPVVLTGVRQDTVTVPAGTFPTTVVRPTIRTKGIFSDNGDAHVWFSDDAQRIPVQVKTRFSKFAVTLTLESVTPGDPSAHGALLAAASR